jgi:hypothetical protein
MLVIIQLQLELEEQTLLVIQQGLVEPLVQIQYFLRSHLLVEVEEDQMVVILLLI